MLATAGGLLVPNFLQAFAQADAPRPAHKTLVVIQLSGGNDGLNTVVPYRNDLYYQQRPTLALPPAEVLPLTDALAFHPALDKLRPLYDQGWMAILNNVGYPNPDRSHFRAMDIWHTASDAHTYSQQGWIGRYLDASCTNMCQAHRAIEVDDTLSLSLKGEYIKGMAMKHPKKLYDALQTDFMEAMAAHTGSAEHAPLHYLYKTLTEASHSAEYIYQRSQTYQPAVTYPAQEFANRLKTVASLIASGIDTRVYYVSLSGFDTHNRQAQQHERGLRLYAESVAAFVADLEKHRCLDDVLIMTFSEFGRRVRENASGGTDHGTANNVFLISKKLKQAGCLYDLPDLTNLDEGDLIHRIDFRQVYATLLERWLDVSSEKILGSNFPLLNMI